MRVAGILAAKGHDVVTVTPRTTIEEVVALLAERSIGAVIVGDGQGGVAGIITERDVVRALAAHGAPALQRPTSDFMTREVVTAGFDDTIEHLMDRMTHGKFRHVPILDGAQLAGIVSIGDVVKHRLAEIEAERQALQEYIATA